MSLDDLNSQLLAERIEHLKEIGEMREKYLSKALELQAADASRRTAFVVCTVLGIVSIGVALVTVFRK